MLCSPGEGYNIILGQCEPCPQNTYKPESVPTDLCFACSEGEQTLGIGSHGTGETVCFG